jgi:hypothetical protein
LDPTAAPAADAADAPRRLAALLVLLVAATFANGLSGAFVLDDDASIVSNASIESLWPPWRVVTDMPPATSGRPLVNLTFAGSTPST